MGNRERAMQLLVLTCGKIIPKTENKRLNKNIQINIQTESGLVVVLHK